MISALSCDGGISSHVFYTINKVQYIYYIFLLLIVGTFALSLFLYLGGKKKLSWMIFAGFFVWALLSVVLGVVFLKINCSQPVLWPLISCLFFVGVMSWAIVRHKFLDMETFIIQVLAVAIWVMFASQFFFIRTVSSRILTGTTLFFLSIFSWWLVRSVKDEIRKKKELADVAKKLKVAHEEMRQLDRAKSEFVSIASHQLRTPLTSIKGFISLILEGSYGRTTKAVREVLEKVYVSNERLIRLVEDLLNISRIESGQLVFKFEKNDIQKTVSDIVESMIFSAQNKNLKLSFKVPRKPTNQFIFDKDKIREVVMNLIDNAIKYTKKGEISVVVKEAVRSDDSVEIKSDNEIKIGKKINSPGNFVQIIVSDTGIGIKPGEEGYIFEKFQRGRDINRVHTEGIGLGLYVAERIVQAHKGRIWAESDGLGKGSRFIVELDKNFVPPKAQAKTKIK